MNWPFLLAIVIFGSIVLAYVLIGGFRATVYNEVLQFLFMFAGLLPLLYFSHKAHYGGLLHTGQYWHLWRQTPAVSSTSQLDLVGVLVGLGGVISFSYWCTDYGLVQRALTARDLESARKVPLIAGFGKLLFAIVVVVPVILMSGHIQYKPGTALDETSPSLIATLYGPRLLGLGIAALVAGLLNSLAANISAFSSLWTGEIYRPFLSSHRKESHYRNVGRAASVCCVATGLLVALWTRSFENLSAFVLLIFSLFVIPFFAVVLTGLISRQTSASSAISGAGAGIIAGGSIQLAFAERWLPSGSRLSANFYSAIVSFAAAAVVCNASHVLSLLRRLPIPVPNIDATKRAQPKASIKVWCLAGTLLVLCVIANLLWW
jgi:SSS family solute:Na+ symporter